MCPGRVKCRTHPPGPLTLACLSPVCLPCRMYRREKSIQIKSSASALYNNLSVLPIAEKCLTYFTVVHCNVVNMVSASGDGLNFSHRQLQSKEGSIAASSSLIIQVLLYWGLSLLERGGGGDLAKPFGLIHSSLIWISA